MVKRTSFEKAECPIARSLDAIGDWWSLLIIRDALLGARRFGEFQKSLGCAKNILTVRLRTLVDQGILKTAPASDGSPYQEYLLTPKGRGVFPVLVALRQWSEEFGFAPDELSSIMVDRESGARVRKLELHAQVFGERRGGIHIRSRGLKVGIGVTEERRAHRDRHADLACLLDVVELVGHRAVRYAREQ